MISLRTTKAKQVHTTLTAKTRAGQPVVIYTNRQWRNLCQKQDKGG